MLTPKSFLISDPVSSPVSSPVSLANLRHKFQNQIRSLFCIEGFEIEGLSKEKQQSFVRDPVAFFIRCDDETAEKIWTIVQSRQRNDL